MSPSEPKRIEAAWHDGFRLDRLFPMPGRGRGGSTSQRHAAGRHQGTCRAGRAKRECSELPENRKVHLHGRTSARARDTPHTLAGRVGHRLCETMLFRIFYVETQMEILRST